MAENKNGAEIVMINGESGSGKSASLENMPVKETVILTPNSKPLPFKGGSAYGKRLMRLHSLREIAEKLVALDAMQDDNGNSRAPRYVVVEDFTHYQNNTLLSDKFYNEGQGSNKFARWEAFGRSVYNSIWAVAPQLKHIKYVIVIGHTAKDADGQYSFKTFGKMVGNSMDPVSYSRIALHSLVRREGEGSSAKNRYVFLTNSDGVHEAKSPKGMFADMDVPNDLYEVLKTIEQYDSGE